MFLQRHLIKNHPLLQYLLCHYIIEALIKYFPITMFKVKIATLRMMIIIIIIIILFEMKNVINYLIIIMAFIPNTNY